MTKHCKKCNASSEIDIKQTITFANGKVAKLHKIVCKKCLTLKKLKYNVNQPLVKKNESVCAKK